MTFTSKNDLTLYSVLASDYEDSALTIHLRQDYQQNTFMNKYFKDNVYDIRKIGYLANDKMNQDESNQVMFMISTFDYKPGDEYFKYTEFIANELCHRCGTNLNPLSRSIDINLCERCYKIMYKDLFSI